MVTPLVAKILKYFFITWRTELGRIRPNFFIRPKPLFLRCERSIISLSGFVQIQLLLRSLLEYCFMCETKTDLVVLNQGDSNM